MPQFKDFNTENKLRIPLSAYAAQIIDNDCLSFSMKRTTLINLIILNHYQDAECSISLRLRDYRAELIKHLGEYKAKQNEVILKSILDSRAKLLKEKYARRFPADVNWQITLNKRVKTFLTEDTYASEETFYGQKPGHYVRALLEDYAQLPYHRREEIVFKRLIDIINNGIKDHLVLNLTNTKGSHLSIKPYKIETDPMSMYHYLVGYNIAAIEPQDSQDTSYYNPPVISIRISRLVDVEIQYYQPGAISIFEEQQIKKELEHKTVQFVSGKSSVIKVWLSERGIRDYESQLHLRPSFIGTDPSDNHIYIFECTEAQILYYFWRFGKEAKIISPEALADRFRQSYTEALNNYN